MNTTTQPKVKRIKRVFTNAGEVLHRWANQTQEDARCSNVFFEGVSAYSYGSHYELGRIIQHNNRTVALINDAGYSNTTRKHIYYAKTATSHLITVCVNDDFTTGCVRRGLVREQDGLLTRIFGHFSRVVFTSWMGRWGARGEYSVGGYADEVSEFNEKCRVLGYPELALDVNSTFIDIYNEKLEDGQNKTLIRDANKSARQAQLRAEREAQAQIRYASEAKDREAWHHQSGPFVGSLLSISPVLLRVKDGMVETSGRASCTVPEAQGLLRAAKAGALVEGTPVGQYRFSRYDEDGTVLIVGCHYIEVAELERVVGTGLTLVAGGAE